MKPNEILTAALLCVLSPISFAKPLEVIILAGQCKKQISNINKRSLSMKGISRNLKNLVE